MDSPEGTAISLINGFRRSRGLKPLVQSPELEWMAREKAAQEAGTRSSSHARFRQRLPGGWVGGEVIYESAERAGVMAASPGAVVRAWIASAGHRRALLVPEWSHLGIARVVKPGIRVSWVANLGRPLGPGEHLRGG